ncbi:MAG: FprA family A-type flavoprotein [Planctomycetes bacterium]|nr:FprA family A-type flavoprotein [Planctomycetota bacterium]
MRSIKPKVWSVGVIDWEARLFDRLIPLPDGTSYNSYLIEGSEKTALIDTVDPAVSEELMGNLTAVGVEQVDYVIANHAEQDHSGSIPAVLNRYPEAKVVANSKCQGMLIDLLDLAEDSFVVVEDGEELSLGDKTLRFVYTPWVHWPETMGTYLVEDKILFSCDFFGAHLATSSLYVDDEPLVYESAKRYYAEIMMPFRRQIRNNLSKLAEIDIDVIAPSHGPMHQKPSFIMDAYQEWVSDEVQNEVVLAYVSMHGSTGKMVRHFIDALIGRGIKVKIFELATVDVGKLAIALVDAATLVIGTSAVLSGPHPCAAYAAVLANALRPKTKVVSIIGSYGWGSKMVEQLAGSIPNIKAEVLEPVLCKGHPKEDTLAALDKLADEILNKHIKLGLL